MISVIQKIKSYLQGRSERSQIVAKNAIGAMLIKIFSIFIDFAKVPVLLLYLTPDRYGVYITIASIIAWTHNFDFGLGTGLRYKLTQSISLGDEERSRRLVSTAYISMSVIMGIVLLISIPIIMSLDWNTIINCNFIGPKELTLCVCMVLAVFVVQFVLELISFVLQSYQRAAISTIFKPLANLLTLASIFVLMQFSYNSLFLACLAMTVPIVIVLFVVNIYYFFTKYRSIAPALKFFGVEYLRDIYSLGLKYFVGQLSSLIIFNTASFLIAHYINPTEVAVYNTAWTYFGIIVMFNAMMLQPLMAAVTDAYSKDELAWIKNFFKKLKLYSSLLSILSLVLLLISPIIFHIWVGDKIIVPWSLAGVMTLYFICNIWVSPYINFLSGVGKMNLMVLLSICKMILFIPIAILALKQWGSIGMIGTILVINTMPNLILGIIQYNKIINKTAIGIWNK